MACAAKEEFFSQSDECRDFALVVQGVKLYVNRELLANWSPVLRLIFFPQGAPFDQPKQGMLIKDKRLDDFLQFLRFVCPSPQLTRKITEENVAALLGYADEYDVSVLHDHCIKFMRKQLDKAKATDSALVDYLHLASLYRLTDLQARLIPLVAKLPVDKIMAAHETLSAAVIAAVYQAKLLERLGSGAGGHDGGCTGKPPESVTRGSSAVFCYHTVPLPQSSSCCGAWPYFVAYRYPMCEACNQQAFVPDIDFSLDLLQKGAAAGLLGEGDVAELRDHCVAYVMQQLDEQTVPDDTLIDYLHLASLYRVADLQARLIPLIAKVPIDKIMAAHDTLSSALLAAVYQAKLLQLLGAGAAGHDGGCTGELLPKGVCKCSCCGELCAISAAGTSVCCAYCVTLPSPVAVQTLHKCAIHCAEYLELCAFKLVGEWLLSICCDRPYFYVYPKCVACKQQRQQVGEMPSGGFSVDLLQKD